MLKLPNFIVIGAPKCGTTSLFYYLKQHPDLFLPVRKELHYFSYEMLKSNVNGPEDMQVLSGLSSSRNEYESHYTGVRSQSAVGEISPSYLYYGVQDRIKSALGLVKIVVMLRNPIEKAYSQYMHMIRDQRETLGFYDALMVEDERRKQGWSDIWRYAESSLYADRLAGYIDCFGRERVHVIFFEEFTNQPQTVMKKLLAFLEIDDAVIINTDETYNRTGEAKSKLLARFLDRPSKIKRGIKALIPEQWRIALRLRIMDANTSQKPPMDARTKAYLRNFFNEDIAKLEVMLGCRLGGIDNFRK